MLAREVGKREGADAVPATGCCFENMRRPDFLDWRAGHAAAQPKKTGCTRATTSRNFRDQRGSRHRVP